MGFVVDFAPGERSRFKIGFLTVGFEILGLGSRV